MDNAAFDVDAPEIELARILSDIRRRIIGGLSTAGIVQDFNGNTVGTFRIE